MNGNTKALREVIEMAEKELTFDELMEEIGLAAKWEERGEARGVVIGEARGEAKGEKNGWEKAIALLKEGYTVEQLEQMSPLSHSPAS
jgi:hypothetical protein